MLGGAVYLYERDRKINARWEAERRARRVEREASLPPAEREARRIAREEAERVYAEQNR